MHKHTPHKTLLVILSIIAAVLILKSGILKEFIAGLGEYGLIGAFIAGIFHAYSFTIAPAIATFIILAEDFNPFLVAFFGAMGATLGSYFLFHLIRDELPKKNFFEVLGREENAIFKKLKYHWIMPLVVAIIFASPIPDEFAVSMLGTAKFSPHKFILLVFFLSFIGISVITVLASAL